MTKVPDSLSARLVAHRGDRDGGIENTLNGFVRAADSGARFAECDIQFTRDLVPVVIHDDSLMRLCNMGLSVSELDLIDLKELCHPYFKLLTLYRLLAWLEGRPQLTLFIEIKPDICKRLQDSDIAAHVSALISEPLLSQIVIISESGGILDACRDRMGCRIGWVAEGDNKASSPLDYIFMHHSESNTIDQWQSRGVKVGLYTINTKEEAEKLMREGADMIETDHFTRMVRELTS